MIPTFQALVVTLLALLPGASYTFAYERIAGGYGVSFSDRIIRFVAASAIFHAMFAGLEIMLYRQFITTDRLQNGDVNALLFELLALVYVLLPTAVGCFIGYGRKQRWRWAIALVGQAPEPRAWDYLWHRNIRAVVRLKLKSGTWLAGCYGPAGGDRVSYAAGHPEEGDLYLAVGLQIDPNTGEFVRTNNRPTPVEGNRGLLIRWAEVEYLDIQEF